MGLPDPAAGSSRPAGPAASRVAAVAAALALAVVLSPAVAPVAAGAAGGAVPGDTGAGDCEGGDRALVVENVSTGERASTDDRLLAAPVENGTLVALEYTHSVEKTRVLDAYEVRGDRLVMVRMEFESYGAGLPSRADVNRTANGSFAFDPAGSFAELYVKPGRVAGHVLHVGNRSVDLVSRSNATTVRLHVAPCQPGDDHQPGDDP